MRKPERLAARAIVFLSLLALSGCGGGGSSTSATVAVITSTTETQFSQDAKILTARVASGPWLPADIAAGFDQDLRFIRARYPQVNDIHAGRDFVLTDLLIAVKTDAPWLPRWQAGTLATNDSAIDSLLSEFNANAVRFLFTAQDHVWFLIQFAQSLNVPRLVSQFKSANTLIPFVEPNGFAGAADTITFNQVGNAKKYTFSKGWGDCPAGCIFRHNWEFAITPDATISLQESGNPLDEAAGSFSRIDHKTRRLAPPRD